MIRDQYAPGPRPLPCLCRHECNPVIKGSKQETIGGLNQSMIYSCLTTWTSRIKDGSRLVASKFISMFYRPLTENSTPLNQANIITSMIARCRVLLLCKSRHCPRGCLQQILVREVMKEWTKAKLVMITQRHIHFDNPFLILISTFCS